MAIRTVTWAQANSKSSHQFAWQCVQPVLIDGIYVCVSREQVCRLHARLCLQRPAADQLQLLKSRSRVLVVPAKAAHRQVVIAVMMAFPPGASLSVDWEVNVCAPPTVAMVVSMRDQFTEEGHLEPQLSLLGPQSPTMVAGGVLPTMLK